MGLSRGAAPALGTSLDKPAGRQHGSLLGPYMAGGVRRAHISHCRKNDPDPGRKRIRVTLAFFGLRIQRIFAAAFPVPTQLSGCVLLDAVRLVAVLFY